MSSWVDSADCATRGHCHACRSDSAWRESVGAPDACPFGVTLATLPVVQLEETGVPTWAAWVEPARRRHRSIEERAACLAACDDCEHQRLLDHDAPACALMPAMGTRFACRGAFEQALNTGQTCPHPGGSRWPAAEVQAAAAS